MIPEEFDAAMIRIGSADPPTPIDCFDMLLLLGAEWDILSDLWTTGTDGNSHGAPGLPALQALEEWVINDNDLDPSFDFESSEFTS